MLEKAAANISVVRGTLSAQRAVAMSSRGRSSIDPKGGQPYAAAAMSLVFHSAHPLIPTLRADVRLFQVGWGIKARVPPALGRAAPCVHRLLTIWAEGQALASPLARFSCVAVETKVRNDHRCLRVVSESRAPERLSTVCLLQVGDEAWYGGGCDLTPNYLDVEDSQSFHRYW